MNKLARNFILLTAILVLILPPSLSTKKVRAGDDPVALLRIDIGSEARVDEVAELDLTFFERLYSQQGELILVASASPAVQQALTDRGIGFKILDPNAAGSQYTLLYGDPEALESLSDRLPVLLIESSIAVALLQPEQISEMLELGLDAAPLVPRPLIAASAAPIPPELPSADLPSAIAPEPLVQEMVSQVRSLDLYTSVGGLSGEWPVTIDGAPYTISTRYTYTEIPIKKATRYAYEFLESLGLLTWYDYYQLNGERRNVIAQQTGLTQPEKIVMLTAHLDSTSYVNGSPATFAPGADDNASGSAALMHIADILSGYDFGCTLRYALFTGEEQGIFGSQAYAADVYAMQEKLLGVLNIDMLGYSTPGSPPYFELHTRYSNSGDLAIANLFRDAVTAYGIQLYPLILPDGKTFSDHSSFWDYNYPAVLAIEDWNDHTPYYHKTGDQLETLNQTYYSEFTKAALATFAHMGCLLKGQLSGTVRDSVSKLGISAAKVEASQNGTVVRSTSTLSNGAYQLSLQPGTYNIQTFAPDHLTASFSNLVISNGQTTPLSPLLSPCAFVRLNPLTASTIMPGVGELVSFGASVNAGETPVTYSWNFGDGQQAGGASVSHAYSAPGSYWVQLTASNPCGVPQTLGMAVFVDMSITYLPLTLRSP